MTDFTANKTTGQVLQHPAGQETNPKEGIILMSNTITVKQAAKRYGLDEGHLRRRAGSKGYPDGEWHKRECYFGVDEFDRWLSSLTGVARAMLTPCSRKGCGYEVDKSAHYGIGATPEGQPIHRHNIADNRPVMPDGILRCIATGQPDPDYWAVCLRAIGDGPWEVDVTISAKKFPKREGAHVKARYQVPEADKLAEAITKAVKVRDRLNRGVE